MLSFFPRGVLDRILNLIESVSEDFPSYSYTFVRLSVHSSVAENDSIIRLMLDTHYNVEATMTVCV